MRRVQIFDLHSSEGRAPTRRSKRYYQMNKNRRGRKGWSVSASVKKVAGIGAVVTAVVTHRKASNAT